MITISYSPFRDVVYKRQWFFHAWQLKCEVRSWLIPRACLTFDHEEVAVAFAFRVCGIEFCVLVTKPEWWYEDDDD